MKPYSYRIINVTNNLSAGGTKIRHVRVSPPIKGHSEVYEIESAGSRLFREIYAHPGDFRCILPKGLEEAGYTLAD